jgi:hypothetical protein
VAEDEEKEKLITYFVSMERKENDMYFIMNGDQSFRSIHKT